MLAELQGVVLSQVQVHSLPCWPLACLLWGPYQVTLCVSVCVCVLWKGDAWCWRLAELFTLCGRLPPWNQRGEGEAGSHPPPSTRGRIWAQPTNNTTHTGGWGRRVEDGEVWKLTRREARCLWFCFFKHSDGPTQRYTDISACQYKLPSVSCVSVMEEPCRSVCELMDLSVRL